MSRYDELELAALVDAVDRAYESTAALDGLHIKEILEEVANVLGLLQEPIAELHAQRLGETASGLVNDSANVDALTSRIDDILDMLDLSNFTADGDDLKLWVEEHRGRHLLLVPEGISLEDAEAAVEAAIPKKDPS